MFSLLVGTGTAFAADKHFYNGRYMSRSAAFVVVPGLMCMVAGGYYTYFFDQTLPRQLDAELLHMADQRHLKRALSVRGLGSNWTPGAFHDKNIVTPKAFN